jgi:pimeloyl-ACP methyl ester carboxylesterase
MDANKRQFGTERTPLLLVPGLMCDSRIFGDQLSAFPQAMVASYGDAVSLAEMARRVLETAPDQFALLGHSMGGRVALEIYRQAPDRVERMALLSTGVHPLRAGEREKRYALRDIGREQGMAALVDAWLPPMIGEAASRDTALVRQLRAMCVEAGLARFEAQIEALLSRPEVDDLLSRISVPTLVAVGSEDRWAPPEQHVAFAASIPDVRFVLIEGAGHMLPAEKPQQLNAAIAEWLGKARVESTYGLEESVDE